MGDSEAAQGAARQQQQPQIGNQPARNENNAAFLRAARGGHLDRVLEHLRNGTDINTCNANGLNALHLASKEGHHEVVHELLRRGAIVDAATRKGNTALHIASLAGQDSIVAILVQNGANPNAQSLNGFTPLYMAAQENHENVVSYLLHHNANQALATEDGFTPLAVALQQGHDRIVALLLENDNNSKVRLPALHIAAKKDDVKAAALLLQNEQNPDVTSKSGFTPLHIAAHYGNENVAQLLLEKGANVNYQARHNISPLHVAAKWGRTNLCNLLLAHGAIIDCRTRDLLTPLHCAARSGHDQVVDLLLEKGAPIAAKTKNGLAPLHMAAQGDHVECARILLFHRANVDDVTVDYLTPLHVAAHCGHVRVAKLLLDRNSEPNARALNGFTPLHIACKKNRIKVVELLLKYQASIEATTESGLSPLHVASFMGCTNIVIYLIQQGANVDVETVRGETPLHLAARANQTDIVRVLVRNGAKVDAQARELQTPLHIASRLGNTDICMLLLQAGANSNAATKDLYTPLHIAAKEGQEEVAVILLDHKADKKLFTKKGFTPLHLACKYGNYGVAKLLLDQGTPVDIQGKNQVTPLHVAAHYNNDRVAQLLLESGASSQATAKNGYTPLHIAAKKNQMDIASFLLQYKADPNAESRAGFTPLHLASEEGHREMAALLMENGSNPNAQAKNGLTPMHLCAQEDRVEVAAELLRSGADVNAPTKAGYTPLHVACHFGQMNMVRFLLENGAKIDAVTNAHYTPLHQAAQQGHNNVCRYLLEKGASPNTKTATGQTPLSIAQRLGYVSVVETLKTVTETTVVTETTTVTEERYKPHNPEGMNETMFSDSEEEPDDAQAHTAEHAKDFNESITQGLKDSATIHLIHTGEQGTSHPIDSGDMNLDEVIKRAQNQPVTTAMPDSTFLDNGHDDNVVITHDEVRPSFLISFLVDARGGAMRGCRHSGVRVIIPPRKAAAPMRITCRYLRKEKLAHPPPLSEGEALASRVLEMGPHNAKFLGPVILEVPHFASLRGREREIVILRSDDGQHWKEHQLEATEDAVQEVLNESFDTTELQQLDDLHTSRITRILTNDFPMYFAVVTRVRQEVHCVGPEGGVILSSVVPRVQAIFPDGSLTKTIKVSLQAQPVPQEIVAKLHGNRVAVSPIVTVEPRRRKFHKPITLCIPLPQSAHSGMINKYQSNQPGAEPPTLRLLCSITGGSSPAQWEDITGTTQLTFTGEEVSFTTTVSARFWLMDTQTPRNAAAMAQEVYNEAIAVPYMAKFAVFARRPYPVEGQLRLFCMTDDKEDKTLEKQESFMEVAKSREVEVLSGRHQFLEFAGNIIPVTKSGDQLSIYFLPFQENRLGFNVKTRQTDDEEAASAGRIAIMKEARIRAENIPPQHPICTLSITLPDYTGPLPQVSSPLQQEAIGVKYAKALSQVSNDATEPIPIAFVARQVGADWPRLARALQVPDADIRQIKREFSGGNEPINILKIWIYLKGTEATPAELQSALRRIGRDDIVHRLNKNDLDSEGDSLRFNDINNLRGSNYSSKVSVDRDYDKSEPHSSEINKTVTRTERYVHESGQGPIVDERTVTTVYKGEQPVDEKVNERTTRLNDDEHQQWHGQNQLPIDDELITNSRQAMITTQEEKTDDGLRTTTTIITSHVVPEDEEHYPQTIEEVEEESEPIYEVEEHDRYHTEPVQEQYHTEPVHTIEEQEPIYVPPTQESPEPEAVHEEVDTMEIHHHEAAAQEPYLAEQQVSEPIVEEEDTTAATPLSEERPESVDTIQEVHAESEPHDSRSPSRGAESATPERPGMSAAAIDVDVTNPLTTLSSSSSSLSTALPIISGVTASGQPLIQNLVGLPVTTTSSLDIFEQPPIFPHQEAEFILVLSGISSNGEPIVQGVVVAPPKLEEAEGYFSAHSVTISEGVKPDSTATPAHSEASGDIFVPIQGGVTESGVPLIQGLTLIPGTFSETLPTATPPPSETGENDDNFEKSDLLPEQEQQPSLEKLQPPERPLFINQSIPDFQPDNAQEEECVVIQSQPQGLCCNDELSHTHQTLSVTKSPLHSSRVDDSKLSETLSYILSNLAKLKMVNQSQYSDVVERLYELEEEMKGAATGLPPDQGLTDLIGRVLAAEYPNADLQIIVSSSRKTTTTKSFYETETPGMVGLEPEKLQELQRKLMTNISSPESAKDAATPGAVPPGLHVPDAEIHPDAAVQKKEVHEEGYADADGSEVVAKKMTRVITTSQSAVSGVNEQPPPYESRDESDTASVSNVSLGSVRDRIAIFESLKDKEAESPPRHEDRRESATLPAAVEAGIVGAAVATFDQMSTTSSKPESEVHLMPDQEEIETYSYDQGEAAFSEDHRRTQPDTFEEIPKGSVESENIELPSQKTEYLQKEITETTEHHEYPIENEPSSSIILEGQAAPYETYERHAEADTVSEKSLEREKREIYHEEVLPSPAQEENIQEEVVEKEAYSPEHLTETEKYEPEPESPESPVPIYPEREEKHIEYPLPQQVPFTETYEIEEELPATSTAVSQPTREQTPSPTAFEQRQPELEGKMTESSLQDVDKTTPSARSPSPEYKEEIEKPENVNEVPIVATEISFINKHEELLKHPLESRPQDIPYPYAPSEVEEKSPSPAHEEASQESPVAASPVHEEEYHERMIAESPAHEEEHGEPVIAEYPTDIHEGETAELHKQGEIHEEPLEYRPIDVPYPGEEEDEGKGPGLATKIAGAVAGVTVGGAILAYKKVKDALGAESEEEAEYGHPYEPSHEPTEAHYFKEETHVREEREAPPSYEETTAQEPFEEEHADPYLIQAKHEHGDLMKEEEQVLQTEVEAQEQSFTPEKPEDILEKEPSIIETQEPIESESRSESRGLVAEIQHLEETEVGSNESLADATVAADKHAYEELSEHENVIEEEPYPIETKEETLPSTEAYLGERDVIPDRPQTPLDYEDHEVVEEVAEVPLTPTESAYYHDETEAEKLTEESKEPLEPAVKTPSPLNVTEVEEEVKTPASPEEIAEDLSERREYRETRETYDEFENPVLVTEKTVVQEYPDGHIETTRITVERQATAEELETGEWLQPGAPTDLKKSPEIKDFQHVLEEGSPEVEERTPSELQTFEEPTEERPPTPTELEIPADASAEHHTPGTPDQEYKEFVPQDEKTSEEETEAVGHVHEEPGSFIQDETGHRIQVPHIVETEQLSTTATIGQDTEQQKENLEKDVREEEYDEQVYAENVYRAPFEETEADQVYEKTTAEEEENYRKEPKTLVENIETETLPEFEETPQPEEIEESVLNQMVEDETLEKTPAEMKETTTPETESPKYLQDISENETIFEKQGDIESYPLDNRPLDIPYPYVPAEVEGKSPSPIHEEEIGEVGVPEEAIQESPVVASPVHEEEHGEPVIAEYPTDIHEGETAELHKQGEIHEEPLEYRPIDVPYPGEEEDEGKGPGLATKIAGAVAGVTVGGAILAYKKVKDALGAESEEEEAEYGHPYEPSHEPTEAHYFKEETHIREEREAPPAYEETTAQEPFEEEHADPYLIQAKHEHGDLVKEEEAKVELQGHQYSPSIEASESYAYPETSHETPLQRMSRENSREMYDEYDDRYNAKQQEAEFPPGHLNEPDLSKVEEMPVQDEREERDVSETDIRVSEEQSPFPEEEPELTGKEIEDYGFKTEYSESTLPGRQEERLISPLQAAQFTEEEGIKSSESTEYAAFSTEPQSPILRERKEIAVGEEEAEREDTSFAEEELSLTSDQKVQEDQLEADKKVTEEEENYYVYQDAHRTDATTPQTPEIRITESPFHRFEDDNLITSSPVMEEEPVKTETTHPIEQTEAFTSTVRRDSLEEPEDYQPDPIPYPETQFEEGEFERQREELEEQGEITKSSVNEKVSDDVSHVHEDEMKETIQAESQKEYEVPGEVENLPTVSHSAEDTETIRESLPSPTPVEEPTIDESEAYPTYPKEEDVNIVKEEEGGVEENMESAVHKYGYVSEVGEYTAEEPTAAEDIIRTEKREELLEHPLESRPQDIPYPYVPAEVEEKSPSPIHKEETIGIVSHEEAIQESPVAASPVHEEEYHERMIAESPIHEEEHGEPVIAEYPTDIHEGETAELHKQGEIHEEPLEYRPIDVPYPGEEEDEGKGPGLATKIAGAVAGVTVGGAILAYKKVKDALGAESEEEAEYGHPYEPSHEPTEAHYFKEETHVREEREAPPSYEETTAQEPFEEEHADPYLIQAKHEHGDLVKEEEQVLQTEFEEKRHAKESESYAATIESEKDFGYPIEPHTIEEAEHSETALSASPEISHLAENEQIEEEHKIKSSEDMPTDIYQKSPTLETEVNKVPESFQEDLLSQSISIEAHAEIASSEIISSPEEVEAPIREIGEEQIALHSPRRFIKKEPLGRSLTEEEEYEQYSPTTRNSAAQVAGAVAGAAIGGAMLAYGQVAERLRPENQVTQAYIVTTAERDHDIPPPAYEDVVTEEEQQHWQPKTEVPDRELVESEDREFERFTEPLKQTFESGDEQEIDIAQQEELIGNQQPETEDEMRTAAQEYEKRWDEEERYQPASPRDLEKHEDTNINVTEEFSYTDIEKEHEKAPPSPIMAESHVDIEVVPSSSLGYVAYEQDETKEQHFPETEESHESDSITDITVDHREHEEDMEHFDKEIPTSEIAGEETTKIPSEHEFEEHYEGQKGESEKDYPHELHDIEKRSELEEHALESRPQDIPYPYAPSEVEEKSPSPAHEEASQESPVAASPVHEEEYHERMIAESPAHEEEHGEPVIAEYPTDIHEGETAELHKQGEIHEEPLEYRPIDVPYPGEEEDEGKGPGLATKIAGAVAGVTVGGAILAYKKVKDALGAESEEEEAEYGHPYEPSHEPTEAHYFKEETHIREEREAPPAYEETHEPFEEGTELTESPSHQKTEFETPENATEVEDTSDNQAVSHYGEPEPVVNEDILEQPQPVDIIEETVVQEYPGGQIETTRVTVISEEIHAADVKVFDEETVPRSIDSFQIGDKEEQYQPESGEDKEIKLEEFERTASSPIDTEVEAKKEIAVPTIEVSGHPSQATELAYSSDDKYQLGEEYQDNRETASSPIEESHEYEHEGLFAVKTPEAVITEISESEGSQIASHPVSARSDGNDLFSIQEPESYLSDDEDNFVTEKTTHPDTERESYKQESYEYVATEDVPLEEPYPSNYDEEEVSHSRKTSRTEEVPESVLQHQESVSSITGSQYSAEGSDAERSSVSTVIRVPRAEEQEHEGSFESSHEKERSPEEELVETQSPGTPMIEKPIDSSDVLSPEMIEKPEDYQPAQYPEAQFEEDQERQEEELEERGEREHFDTTDYPMYIHTGETEDFHRKDDIDFESLHQRPADIAYPEYGQLHEEGEKIKSEEIESEAAETLSDVIPAHSISKLEERPSPTSIEDQKLISVAPDDYETYVIQKREELLEHPLESRPQDIPYPYVPAEVEEKSPSPIHKEETIGIVSHEEAIQESPVAASPVHEEEYHERMIAESPVHEEEHGEPVIAEYPTDIHEGETAELHKQGEIHEEPLEYRPIDVPYPGKEEDEGKEPGLATKIAGAVTGVTVGGAILAYKKVKDALGGESEEEEAEYGHPYEPSHEPTEAHYLKEETHVREEREAPPSYEETTAQEPFEEEHADPYLIQAKHEHGDLMKESETFSPVTSPKDDESHFVESETPRIIASEKHEDELISEHEKQQSPSPEGATHVAEDVYVESGAPITETYDSHGLVGAESYSQPLVVDEEEEREFYDREAHISTQENIENQPGEPLTESQIANTPEEEKRLETENEDYGLIESGAIAAQEAFEEPLASPRPKENEQVISDEYDIVDTHDIESPEHSDITPASDQGVDLMTQSVHPDYFKQSEETEEESFELIETDDIKEAEKQEQYPSREVESPKASDDWQTVAHEGISPEVEKDIMAEQEEHIEHPLESKTADIPYLEKEQEKVNEGIIEKREVRLGEYDGDEESVHHHLEQSQEEHMVKHLVGEPYEEKPIEPEGGESDVEMRETEFAPDSLTTSSTDKIEEHAEEIVKDVLEQIEAENLMEMSQDSLNFPEEHHRTQIPKIAEDDRENEFENIGLEDSLNIVKGPQPTSMLGVRQEIPAFRPSSPIPPDYARIEGTEEQPDDEKMEVDSLNGESNGSSGEASVIDASKKKKHTSYDNVSESSLQEFERLEYEIREHVGDSPTSEGADFEKVVESQAGSVSSLIEFENIEREVRESAMTQAASAEEVMMLSDIREESEIEEMSVREDDEDEEDSLSESKPPQIGHDERQSQYPVETMLTSTDSLEAVIRQPILLETSTDSLEPREQYNFSPNQNEHDEYTRHQPDQDSLLEGVSQSNLSQETQMLSGDTVATYQEYQDDDNDEDSLTEVMASYPTTMTTFETVQRKDDGSVETISRRVMTRVTDPIHSRVRFTGTEDEQRLHNIPTDHPVETVDEEGNVTTTQCRRTPTN